MREDNDSIGDGDGEEEAPAFAEDELGLEDPVRHIVNRWMRARVRTAALRSAAYSSLLRSAERRCVRASSFAS